MASGELLTCLIQLCHTTVLTSHSVVVSLGCGEGTDGGTAQQTGMRFNGDSSLFLHQTTKNFFFFCCKLACSVDLPPLQTV